VVVQCNHGKERDTRNLLLSEGQMAKTVIKCQYDREVKLMTANSMHIATRRTVVAYRGTSITSLGRIRSKYDTSSLQ
jgi:hypothetical protein